MSPIKYNYVMTGVFRKLPQPSVSPAAPHPGLALLGAAENDIENILYINNNLNNIGA